MAGDEEVGKHRLSGTGVGMLGLGISVFVKKETKQQQNCLGVFFDFGCDQWDENM